MSDGKALMGTLVIVGGLLIGWSHLNPPWVVVAVTSHDAPVNNKFPMTCKPAGSENPAENYIVWTPLSERADHQPGDRCPMGPEDAKLSKNGVAPTPDDRVVDVIDKLVICGLSPDLATRHQDYDGASRFRVGDPCPIGKPENNP